MPNETDAPPPEMSAEAIAAAGASLCQEMEAFLHHAYWPVVVHAMCSLLARAVLDERQPLQNVLFMHNDVMQVMAVVHARMDAMGAPCPGADDDEPAMDEEGPPPGRPLH